ncbi:zinc ribbon domain-containing protein [Candidatus Dojkabacteria bacterium]|jgi:hypothetical protein|nr:zinc ribbon domain-containing protein [Candidatus Dojkabacteria bacterium]
MNLEQILLTVSNSIGNADFTIIIYVVSALFIVFWIFVLGWVWIDSGERTTNKMTRLVGVILVAVLNIIGLIIYLIVRPKQTIQELYWADLERRYLKYETAELGDCPNCGFSLQPGFNICPKCKYEIKINCKGCQMWIDKTYTYCPFCAKATRQVEEGEEVIASNEEMEEEINKSKEEAISVVTGNKTKYVDRHGILSKIKGEISKIFKKKEKKVVKKVVSKKKVSKKNKKKR